MIIPAGCYQAVAEKAFEALEPEVSVVEETTEELHDLHSQQHTLVQRKISFEEELEMGEVISTRDIKKVLGMWEKVVEFVDKNYPEKVATKLTNSFRQSVKKI